MLLPAIILVVGLGALGFSAVLVIALSRVAQRADMEGVQFLAELRQDDLPVDLPHQSLGCPSGRERPARTDARGAARSGTSPRRRRAPSAQQP
ncbi:MAG: hypothetical protein ABSG95_14360 [Solirubrobacteraceae bacterium]